MWTQTSLTLLLAGALACPLTAAIELPSFFSDGMVLQQESEAKIWGWLDAPGKVEVTFAEKTESAKTDDNGRWEVSFKGLTASAEGRAMTISGGKESKTLQDVLVGEVWVASGQSNMEWTMSRCGKEVIDDIAASQDPLLRVYLSRNFSTAEPQIDFPGKWTAAAPDTTGNMTAVGYYYARKLRAELKVPVAIIECAWGGKPVEAFISEEAFHKLPEAKGLIAKKAQAVANWNPKAMAAAHEKKIKRWTENGKKGGRPSVQPEPSMSSRLHSTIYNGMIAPLAGYSARGVIWYQGESNANGGTAAIYEELLGCLVQDWRTRWDSKLSFYYVQLANFRQPVAEPGTTSGWVVTQDEMRRALDSISNSGMAVANDIGAADNIHPTNKLDVGERLARWALNKDYQRKEVVVSGPLFQKAEEKNGRMEISFDHSTGLKSRDGGKLQRFEIKAEDGAWVWAQAQIEGEKIIVWSDAIPKPAAVRYAWAENPKGANLVNGEDLPTSCFTTEK